MSYETLSGKMQLRPIEEWPGEMTPETVRRRSPFSANWRTTMNELDRELYNLGAEAIVLQVAMAEKDFRIDGLPRAQARAEHPGVILSFNPDGVVRERMQFATDVFWHWQENVRAIALGLEALRKVDRYGITRGRSQYAGFKALTMGDDGKYGLYTADEALRFVTNVYGDLKTAIKATHPDNGGSAEAFHKVMRAKELLA